MVRFFWLTPYNLITLRNSRSNTAPITGPWKLIESFITQPRIAWFRWDLTAGAFLCALMPRNIIVKTHCRSNLQSNMTTAPRFICKSQYYSLLHNRGRDFGLRPRQFGIVMCALVAFQMRFLLLMALLICLHQIISVCIQVYFMIVLRWRTFHVQYSSQVANDFIWSPTGGIGVADVTNAINKLKSGKSDGYSSGLSSDYMHVPRELAVYISLLLTALLTHAVTVLCHRNF